jgi:hypothetical protein
MDNIFNILTNIINKILNYLLLLFINYNSYKKLRNKYIIMEIGHLEKVENRKILLFK